MKHKIQITQNKSIRYRLQLDKMTHISKNQFQNLNWLPVKDRFKQSINSIVFKYFIKQCPSYLNEVFELASPNNLKNKRFVRIEKLTWDKTHSLSLVSQ